MERNVLLPLSAEEARSYRTGVTLLGTSGGPCWWDGSNRSGISTIIRVEDSLYLIDCGEGWGPRLRQAGLGPTGYQRGLDNMRAVFITHHHSDHLVDYPNLLLFAWHNGGDHLQQPIRVFGPGDRGVIPPVFGEEQGRVAPPIFNPESPTPGLKESSEKLVQAFALDINDRMRDIAKPDLSELFEINDIPLPGSSGDDPNGNPAPTMEPFEVYRDELVRVTAILVDHRPVFPAFAYRFETADGSIVISGDTGVCDNLVTIADGADLLLHECIDMDWMDELIGPHAAEPDPNLMQHMLAAHTSIEEVGPQAERAGVRTLVLTHLVPAQTPVDKWQRAQAGFSGNLIVGEDLMSFGIGSPTN